MVRAEGFGYKSGRRSGRLAARPSLIRLLANFAAGFKSLWAFNAFQ